MRYIKEAGSEREIGTFELAAVMPEVTNPETREAVFSLAEDTVRQWMVDRAVDNKPFLAGWMTSVDFLHALPLAPQLAEADSDPVALFWGHTGMPYNTNLTDAQTRECLEDLASALGEAMGHATVYVIFAGKVWKMKFDPAAAVACAS
jgi:hypothetical protein